MVPEEIIIYKVIDNLRYVRMCSKRTDFVGVEFIDIIYVMVS